MIAFFPNVSEANLNVSALKKLAAVDPVHFYKVTLRRAQLTI